MQLQLWYKFSVNKVNGKPCDVTRKLPSAPFHITLGKGAPPPLHPRPEGGALTDHPASRSPAAMSDASGSRAKHAAPWRGRRRVADAKGCFIAVRCTVQSHTAIKENAAKAGLSIGAYLRALAVGSPGPRSVRRPPIERAELARLLRAPRQAWIEREPACPSLQPRRSISGSRGADRHSAGYRFDA